MIPISGAKSGDVYAVSAEAAPSFNGFVGITGITFDFTPRTVHAARMCNCSFSVHLVGSKEKKLSTLDSQLSIPLDSGEMIPQNFLSGRITRTKWNARIALTLAMVAFTSCSTVTVRTEHDPGTNFAGYRTYAFGPSSPNVLALSPSVRAQIESSLNQGLTARGLRQATRPDFYVSYHVTTREQISEQTFHDWGHWSHGGPGWNSYSLWLGDPITTSYVHRSTVGTLVVDFVDARTDRAFWSGVATGTVRASESNRQNIVDAVHRMLESFPPS